MTTDGPAPPPGADFAQGQSFTSGAKDTLAASLSARVWATIGQGILNEIYWPAVDQPQTKDFGFLVAGDDWWVEVKRAGNYTVDTPDPAVPISTVTHSGPDYELSFTVLADPVRDALLISYELQPSTLRLYPLLAPHMGVYQAGGGATGEDNQAWVEADAGVLGASDGISRYMALLGQPGFERASVGYVGLNDGWTDFASNGRMTWRYDQAGPGTVALIGELPGGVGVLALAFGKDAEGARAGARQAVDTGFDAASNAVREQWTAWSSTLTLPRAGGGISVELADAVRRSATVLRVHEDRDTKGAFIAGLAVPWGDYTNDSDHAYHMCWCRDAVETALALVALGDHGAGLRLLDFLTTRQEPDGHWPRCFYVDGSALAGEQLDETGFPILLAGKLDDLGEELRDGISNVATKACAYLVRHGPTDPQTPDRWEETPGASPFTIGIEVAALVAGSRWLSTADSGYALSLADCWNERIEEWTSVQASEVDAAFGTTGHYVRIGLPTESIKLAFPPAAPVSIGNQPGPEHVPADRLVGLEFLYLCRLGLRDPGMRLITDTVTVVDALLARDAGVGTAYYRYDVDGYGEWTDGTGWVKRGYGIGRPWPLLAGERGHYEKLAGRDAMPYLRAMLAMRGAGGLLPEQMWDSNPIPWYRLAPGRPTGSAMPLAWAHSELIKLALTTISGRPVELLDAVRARWNGQIPKASTWYWQDAAPVRVLPHGRSLVVQHGQPFTLHFGFDGWQAVSERDSEPLGLGMQGVRLAADELSPRQSLQFVRRFASGWEPSPIHEVNLKAAPVAARRPSAADAARAVATRRR